MAGCVRREARRLIIYKEGDRLWKSRYWDPAASIARRWRNWSGRPSPRRASTADIEKVSDIMKIAKYGVFGTPAVVVDGEVKSVGKIPKKEEILSWLGVGTK